MDVSGVASPSAAGGPAQGQVLSASAVAEPAVSPAPQAAAEAPAPPIGPGPLKGGIAPAIAKLFGSGDPQPIPLNVSYRVVKGLDEIVTVFTDPQTGKEIAQVPSEILIGLAQFFDHEHGATLDQSA